jgi:hypothetical protein
LIEEIAVCSRFYNGSKANAGSKEFKTRDIFKLWSNLLELDLFESVELKSSKPQGTQLQGAVGMARSATSFT